MLAERLVASDYDVVVDPKTGAPEIAGYSKAYLRAASQRSAQIDENLAKAGLDRRARTTKRAVRVNRAAKGDADPQQVRAAQLALAREYGDQHRAVIDRMLARGPRVADPERERAEAAAALAHALADRTSRSATTTERDVLSVALRAGLTKTSLGAVREALDAAVACGDVVTFPVRRGPGLGLTTREMLELERSAVATCLGGRDRCAPLLADVTRRASAPLLADLSDAQRRALASTRLVRALFDRLGTNDRVLLVGDVAQHESVEAGRMFAQLQEAGIGRSVLDEIRRQADPALRTAVGHLAGQNVSAALAELRDEQIRQIRSPEARFRAIAAEFARHPECTLVVAPTHLERREITAEIRRELRAAGALGREVVATALDPRNDYTEPGRKKAFTYLEGDVVRFRVGSRARGIEPGSYATVAAVDETNNRVAVTTGDGRTVVYDPSRLAAVEIYRERERAFAVGDRVIVTLGDRTKRIPKSAVGAIVDVDGTAVKVRLDDGRTTRYDLATFRHLDHAYVLTSHASQSLTTSRVLVHVDTGHAEAMVNERFAYVAASRAVHDALLFTDRADLLAAKLGRSYSNTSALEATVDAPRAAGLPACQRCGRWRSARAGAGRRVHAPARA